MNNLFSIIVVTYNRHELLKACLKSFQGSTYTNFELIVVDRGSTPSVQNIVSELCDNRFKYVASSQDEHFCDIGNKVLSTTNGNYICVFGDDDIIHDKALELVAKAFDKHDDCDIITIGSLALLLGKQKHICIPSDFSTCSDFNYFDENVSTFKLSGKDYLKWIMSAQFIGPNIKCNFPSYLHPSTMFIKKGNIYDKVVKKQNGLMVKPSFDTGYLGIAYHTNILYLNVPLCVIQRGNNVSTAARRFWNKEVEDHKYMPKIAQLENRGADSILNVLHLNNIDKEFDTKIQFKLYKMILKSITKDPIWDKQTFADYTKLFPYYLKNSKFKIIAIIKFISSIISGILKHLFSRKKQEERKEIVNIQLSCVDVCNTINIIYEKQLNNLSKDLSA